MESWSLIVPSPLDILHARVRPIVASLVETVVSAELGVDDLDGVAHLDATTEVMARKLRQMPPHLGNAMAVMTLLFDSAGLASGARFCSKDLPARRAQLATWKGTPVSVLSDFVAFYEKMGSFTWYCHVEEAEGGHA